MTSTLQNITHVKPTMNDSTVCGKYLYYPDNTGNRVDEGGLRLQGKYKQNYEDQPLVSIITVCKNSESTIEQTFTSVFNQTYANIEYIVIDGGSSDGTLSIINKYSDFIDYFVSEPDNGIYHAMNKGLSLVNGEYILILNADDWYTDDCVEALINAKKYSKRDIISGLACYVNDNGKILHVLRHMPYNNSIRLRMALRHELMLIPAKAYNRIGIYDLQYEIIADLEMAIRLFEAGYTLYELQRPLLYFRNTGVSNTEWKKLYTEREKLIKSQFPFLQSDEVSMLSQLKKFSLKQATSLISKYSCHEAFIKSLIDYIHDRRKLDWKNDSISHLMHVSKLYYKNVKNNISSRYGDEAVKNPQPQPCPSGSDNGISIIITAYRSSDSLDRLLSSFFMVNSHLPVELIIIDQDSRDNTPEILHWHAHKRVIRFFETENASPAKARNLGAEKARYPYLLFLDSPAIFTSDILNEALSAFDEASVGVVSVRIDDINQFTVSDDKLNEVLHDFSKLMQSLTDCKQQKNTMKRSSTNEPTVQHLGVYFTWNKRRKIFQPYAMRHPSLREYLSDISISHDCPTPLAVSGQFFLCRKADFIQLAGFCEVYDNDLTCIDLCMRFKKDLSKICKCMPHISIQYEPEAGNYVEKQSSLYIIEMNQAIFQKKWQEYIVHALKDE